MQVIILKQTTIIVNSAINSNSIQLYKGLGTVPNTVTLPYHLCHFHSRRTLYNVQIWFLRLPMVQDFSLPTLYFPLQNSISPISPFLSSVPFPPVDMTDMASLGLWLGPKSPKISFFTTFLFFHRISTKIEKSCSFSTCNCTVRKCTFEQTFRGVDSTLERNGPISDENKC